jgi:purine-cytosine permease-like protein
MCQARYSFGYYPVLVPTVLNIIGMLGFCILNCILGGQTLSAVSGGGLSWT